MAAVPLTENVMNIIGSNSNEIAYFTTLFEHYTKEQIAKELKTAKNARLAAAMAIAGNLNMTPEIKTKFLNLIEQQKNEEIEQLLFDLMSQSKKAPSSMQAFWNKAVGGLAQVVPWMEEKYSGFIKKIKEGDPGRKAFAEKAANIFRLIGTAVKLGWLKQVFGANKRIGIIDRRYGMPATKLAFETGRADPNRFWLVDRYKDVSAAQLKQTLNELATKHLWSSLTMNQLMAKAKAAILLAHDPRFAGARYGSINGKRLKLTAMKAGSSRNSGDRYANLKFPSLSGTGLKLKAGSSRNSGGRYANLKFPALDRTRPAAPEIKKSESNKMANAAEIAAEVEKLGIANEAAKVKLRANLSKNKATALAYINRLSKLSASNRIFNIYQLKRFDDRTSLVDLLRIRQSNSQRQPPEIRSKLDSLIRFKVENTASRLSSNQANWNRVALISNAMRSNRNMPGSERFVNGVRRLLERVGTSGDVQSSVNRLQKIARAARGLNIRTQLSNAAARINRLKRNENNRRRERGLPPTRNYVSGGGGNYSRGGGGGNYSRGVPVYPPNVRPPSYGNVRPTFQAPPNLPMPGIMPMPPPLQPYPSIPVNNRTPQRPENILPPTEAAAVQNAGGMNKALNLVENAGGPANVARTAEILRNVGNNPNAAIAAGANAKNVKIVLQLGGANNALKVASAVPKIKKRRRSKKPKPPRVKEIKKLIKWLGSKENLVKKLPDPNNKEKKLTKNQVVSKITRYLLRKGK